MGEAEGGQSNRIGSASSSRTMESLSLEINRYPRDLLTRFVSAGGDHQKRRVRTREEEEEEEEEDEEEEIELNLGLSLGGRFGVDKAKLARSSSIAGSIPDFAFRESERLSSSPKASYNQLMRTSSLPTETEEEWRKRKEMQSLRRLEAKRRRSEKQRRGEMSLLEEDKKEVLGSRGTLVGCRQGGLNRSREGSQGSVESHGGGGGGGSSSGVSAPIQGSASHGESRSPIRNHPSQDQSSHPPPGPSRPTEKSKSARPSGPDSENHKRSRETGTSAMQDMPCVFTVGDGPNGRRIEGILYKYGRGEEVRIMCVCHGTFLSPAEFVKHAGGSNVDHPLRHIVVNPAGPSFL